MTDVHSDRISFLRSLLSVAEGHLSCGRHGAAMDALLQMQKASADLCSKINTERGAEGTRATLDAEDAIASERRRCMTIVHNVLIPHGSLASAIEQAIFASKASGQDGV